MEKVKECFKSIKGKVANSKLAKRMTLAFVGLQGYAINAMAAPNQDGYTMVESTIDMATTWVN